MKRYLTSVAVVCALLSPTLARADFVSWQYNWTPSVLSLAAGTGGMTLTNEPANHADGSSDVVATNLRVFSSAARSHPDRFTHAGYSLSLALKDVASGQSAVLVFSGFFDGAFSATSANVLNTFSGVTTQSRKLGDHTYTVTIGKYAPPGPPTATNAGSIGAHVGVDEFTPPPPPPNDAPEPSTMLLAGAGMGCLGLTRLLRRKRA
jgi:hypothetical protein